MDDKAKKIAEAKKALLAKRLKSKAGKGGAKKPAVEKIPQLNHAEPVPLSLSQQRFWFTHQLDQSQASHNMYDVWRVTGEIDYDALQWALSQLVERQTILRTKIRVVDGTPMQLKHPAAFFRFTILYTDEEQTTEYHIEHETNRPFDLEKDPLIRLALIPQNTDLAEHVLVLTIHHIISDEYSNAVIWNELAQFYATATNTSDPQPIELPIQFRDFSEWQTGWINQRSGQKQLAYWEKQLSGDITNLQLPHDKIRPTNSSGRGQMLSHPLSPNLSEAIGALSKKTGATPFMIWMAIFQLLLYRYTQQKDVWVGTPIGNRQRPEVKNLVGLFLNTAVVRTQIDDTQTFKDLLKQVQGNALSAFANQDIPFDQVVNKVQPNRDSGLTPLFQTMLVYSPPPKMPQFKGLTFEKVDHKSQFAKLDLTLFVMGGPNPKASIQYSTDLFEADTIARMLGHLEVLATALTKDPTKSIGQYPLLTRSEETKILQDWNESQPAPPTRGKVLHGLILKHGKVKPDHPAVIAGDQTLTYQELDLQSANLARYLQAKGVNGKSNPFIGVMVDRRPEMLVGILAILRAGGAYVPIDPDYPAERIEHIVSDAQLDIILTTGDYALPESIDRPINLVDLSEPLEKQDVADLSQIAKPTPNSNAYLIYTSGSTGKPKGVMVSHANIVHSTTARYSFYPTPAERFLLLSSFAFDSSMVGIFWTLCQGGTLILPEQGMHQNVSWLNKTIAKEQVTHLLALPSLYQILLEESEPKQLESLNTVMVAGEACHAGLVEMHYRQYPNSSLYNEYGPTEGTVWSHAYRFPENFVGPVVPIGKAIPNVTQYILDHNSRPVPVGVPGELVIGGAGITKGYLNRPELTAEKFVSLPHLNEGEDEHARFYRTGDLVKWREDGNVIFLGRVDHQVKIRGFRIELGEVESLLLTHPAVKMGAVGIFEPPANNISSMPEKQLSAWFTAESELDPNSLKNWISKRLPTYMVPAMFMQLETMPLTPNGKVNRNVLPTPKVESISVPDSHQAPSNKTEKELAQIWQTVLGIDKISITDSFFDLGGHSLMAIKIFAQIEKRLATNLPLATIFQLPTIRSLAKRIDQKEMQASLTEQMLVPIQPKGSQPPIFFLHDGAGYVFQYEYLAQVVGKDQPVYGIIPSDWDGKKKDPLKLANMVNEYLQVIKSIQPAGPYNLSGFSVGGVLAYEIACKLQAAGETIGTLALIEPTPWNYDYLIKRPNPISNGSNGTSKNGTGNAEAKPNSNGVPWLKRHFTNLKNLARSPKQMAIYVSDSLYGRGFRIYESISEPINMARINASKGVVPRSLRDYYYLHVVSLEMMQDYKPTQFNGDLHLFMIERGPLVEPAIGWNIQNQGRTIVHTINVNEHSKLMKEPHVFQVGKILKNQLVK